METYSHLTTGELIRTLLPQADRLSNLEFELVERLENIQMAVLEMESFRYSNPEEEEELEALRAFLTELLEGLNG